MRHQATTVALLSCTTRLLLILVKASNESILAVLGQLAGEIDVEQVGPTKQHGIPRSAAKRG
jgi:hypothetical protein